ncbi:hypothetical protein [Streptomyces sp. DHE17-7]|uniref:hypothetical protein n=1 Tax=Streptomyces sp. DHE17-7 TaxID=2759949 RepID=UPI0022EA7A88|nr:hypothetical protein [Streptomyces sp. DHE17-7]
MAGWSAYPRQLDFAAFRKVADEVGAYLMATMALASRRLTKPVAARRRTTPHHNELDARRGVSSSNCAELQEINSAVFPGQQGGQTESTCGAKPRFTSPRRN